MYVIIKKYNSDQKQIKKKNQSTTFFIFRSTTFFCCLLGELIESWGIAYKNKAWQITKRKVTHSMNFLLLLVEIHS